MSDEPVTIGERYSTAIRSSNLRVKDSRGDADVIIAIALQRQRLATMLFRLRVEYDATRLAPRQQLIDRALVSMGLRTLRKAREALGRHACAFATRRRYMVRDETVLLLTDRVLDAWLDPLCHACDGRGFNGGSHRGDRRLNCSNCGGTGLRADRIGKNAAEREFAAALMVDIEQMLSQVAPEARRRMG